MTPDELRAWRAHWMLSQRGLAELLGVHHQTVAKWEQGDREIPPYLGLALETLGRRRAAELVERAQGPLGAPA